MDAAESIEVEVAYALPDEQAVYALSVPEGTTARQAIEQSGVLGHFPDVDLATIKVGIFGKACPLTQTLREGDRVEIYRPLIADPKEVRKQRAAAGKVMKRGAGEAGAAEGGEEDAEA